MGYPTDLNTYAFLETVPEGCPLPAWEVSLFNTPAHLRLQSREGWKTFYIRHNKTGINHGFIHVHVTGKTASSPLRSSFGSFEFDPGLSGDVLFSFIAFVEQSLKDSGVSRLVIKNPPLEYDPENLSLLITFLMNRGFRVSDAAVGSVLKPASVLPDKWEARKLRQSKAANLSFSQRQVTDLEEIYKFILSCRETKGYSLSMTMEALAETVSCTPDKFLLFTVTEGDRLAAASIAIRVNDRVLYNFYSDHHADFDALSPVVMLIDGMGKWCVSNSVSMLDLGTSAKDGMPNFPLLDFKLRLGAIPTPKFTLEKML